MKCLFYPTIHTSVVKPHALMLVYMRMRLVLPNAVNFDLANSNGDALEHGLRGAVGSPATERVLWLRTVFRRGTCTRSRDEVGLCL